jgi:hypothetical protein
MLDVCFAKSFHEKQLILKLEKIRKLLKVQ